MNVPIRVSENVSIRVSENVSICMSEVNSTTLFVYVLPVLATSMMDCKLFGILDC